MENKSWYNSLTIWGTGILTLCSVILPLISKIDLANALQAEQGNILDVLAGIGATIGTILAIIGRIRAKTRITT